VNAKSTKANEAGGRYPLHTPMTPKKNTSTIKSTPQVTPGLNSRSSKEAHNAENETEKDNRSGGCRR
jgi:hypothetical protein